MIACAAHRCIAGSRIEPPPKGKGAQYVFVGAPSQRFCNMFGWSAGMRGDAVRYRHVGSGGLHSDKCHAGSLPTAYRPNF